MSWGFHLHHKAHCRLFCLISFLTQKILSATKKEEKKLFADRQSKYSLEWKFFNSQNP